LKPSFPRQAVLVRGRYKESDPGGDYQKGKGKSGWGKNRGLVPAKEKKKKKKRRWVLELKPEG